MEGCYRRSEAWKVVTGEVKHGSCYRRSEAWKVVTGEVKHGRLLQEK